MKLKSLEIKGFKSFANATVLNFNEDVTGVVGPNGSGKSNIVDAIRWVLGEQKGKELRLDNRSDVIFNGAKAKKPAGVAKVSIIFENTKNILPTEFNEVKISRLQYRNGDSEYQLNGVKCRLRDINDLLVDTGIGSNSYAIIALGMVEDILKDKDNARRKMFEQVAGISKYKKRKKETLNKLKSTAEDLDRVEDLLHEILGNMKSLEKQAKRTEVYFKLKEDYKTESIKYAVLSVADLKEKHAKFSAKIEEAQDKYRNLEVETTTKEAEIEAQKKSQLSEEENLSEQQRQVNKIVTEIRENEAAKDLLKQQLSFKEESAKNSANVVERNKPVLLELKNEKTEKSNLLKILIEEIGKLTVDFESTKTAHEKAQAEYQDSKSKFDVLAEKRQSLEQDGFEKAKDLAIQNNKQSVLENDIKIIDSEVGLKQVDSKELEQEIGKIETEIDAISKEVQEREAKKIQVGKDQEELENKRTQTEQELVKINRSLDSKNNEHTLLKSMIENLEGFPESIKFLSKKWNSSVPILSDILDVDQAYKGIIEHFLEPYLNHYLVANVEEAAEAIKLLSNSQKGKAQFFLLDSIPKVATLEIDKIGERANQVVKVDAKYQALLDYLLKDVFLTDVELETLKDNKTYLSKRGSFVKRARSVSGGSVGLFEGKKIGRKKELEKLIKDIKELENKKENFEKDLQDLDLKIIKIKESHSDTELIEAKENLNLVRQRFIEIKTKKNGLDIGIQELENKRQIAEAQLGETINGLKDLQTQIAFIEKAMGSTEVANADPGQLDILAQNLSREAQNFNTRNIELIQKQSEKEKLESDIAFNERRFTELSTRMDEADSLIKNNSEESETINNEIAKIETILKEQYELRDKSKNELSQFEQEFFGKRNSIAELEEKLRADSRKLQQTQLFINETKDKFNDVKFQLGAVGERLKIEFEVELDDVLKMEFEHEGSVRELKDFVEKLRRRINNFGEINPMAVEAFNTMKERHDLIAGQRDDILEAKESLMATISEIEESATELFKDCFDKVRENFKTVFRSLFSEDDSCDLILEDAENPLESKIEIIAKPKGKRPLSLSQLSGGEMTLTATALLFAFYLQKPAPFCIFDEVDAPLDDVNVLKFNKIIKRFSKESQFVIVTHNKATMAEVDVLYGVYMQDMGISGVSPVDFRKFGHDPILENVK